jgi:hypothetical protein
MILPIFTSQVTDSKHATPCPALKVNYSLAVNPIVEKPFNAFKQLK